MKVFDCFDDYFAFLSSKICYMEHNDGHIYTQHTLGYKTGDLLNSTYFKSLALFKATSKMTGFVLTLVILEMQSLQYAYT